MRWTLARVGFLVPVVQWTSALRKDYSGTIGPWDRSPWEVSESGHNGPWRRNELRERESDTLRKSQYTVPESLIVSFF